MKLVDLAAKITGSIKPLDDVMGAGEAALLAVVVRLATWGAAIPNAVLVARSASQTFKLSIAWGFVISISLELIGHSLIEYWQASKDWNNTKRISDPIANVGLALVLVICFFIIDFSMVGALAYANFEVGGDWRYFLSLFYPLIGVGVAIATDGRARLFRLKQAVQAEREAKKAERVAKQSAKSETEAKSSEQPSEQSELAPLVIPLTCEVCGQGFATQNALNAHQRKHSEVKRGNGHKVKIAEVV